MVETESVHLEDPFHGQHILSLLPRTFRDSGDALKSMDLEAIHEYMSSMDLQSADKHFEEARSIIDGSSEILKTAVTKANVKDKENPKERRPALVRKRAQFSMKPDTSQPSTTVDPSVQFSKLQDPEEFFAAYDKLENTIKELKRQKGGEDLDEVKFSMNVRRRRPQISGRKVSYKHYDYSSNDISLSQEKLQDYIGSPPTNYSQQQTVIPNKEPEEELLAGSVSKIENRVNKLFDELISSDIDKLDENDAMSFLKDHLNIKSVDIDNLCLPDFHDVRRTDFDSPSKNLPNDLNRLSDTCTLPDGLRSKTPARQKNLSDTTLHPIASPTPPRSPFLAISTLGKLMSKSVASVYKFAARDINSSPTTSSIEVFGEQSGKGKEFPISGTSSSLAEDKVTKTPVGAFSQKVSAEASINLPDKTLVDTMHGDLSTSLTESLIGSERVLNDNAIGHADTNSQTTKSPTERNAVEDLVQKVALHLEYITDNVQPQSLEDMEDNVEDVQMKAGTSTLSEINIEDPMVKNVKSNEDTMGANSTEEHTANESTQVLDIVPEQQNEEQPKTQMENRRKTRLRKVNQKKRRQSLAEAGSSWSAGVRRSKRKIKRPLEYWKGERFLYGRVHNSLPTVIGVKYISPTKDNGKPGFKVESYVSNKYKELVEFAALH